MCCVIAVDSSKCTFSIGNHKKHFSTYGQKLSLSNKKLKISIKFNVTWAKIFWIEILYMLHTLNILVMHVIKSWNITDFLVHIILLRFKLQLLSRRKKGSVCIIHNIFTNVRYTESGKILNSVRTVHRDWCLKI